MTPGSDRAASPRRLAIDALSQDVRDARAAVRRHRHGPATSPDLTNARRNLTVALEDYITALERRHLPVPHALRAELQMHRQLFDW